MNGQGGRRVRASWRKSLVMKSLDDLPLSAVMLLIVTVLVGAVVSIVINCVATVPVLPAVSVTLNWIVLELVRLASAWLIAVPVTELVMSVKLTPLSFEYSRISPVKRPLESVAVTVKPALSDVIKSVAELPLSSVMLLIVTVLVGAVVSIVINCVAIVPVLPAVSVTLNWTVLVLVRLPSA